MDAEERNHWEKIFAEAEKKRRRMVPIKRNQLSLWLGRLIITYNNLENSLAYVLMKEFVELIGKDEPPVTASWFYVAPSMQRATNGGLSHIIMATLSFKQKLDFLTALLFKRFANDQEHLEHIKVIAGLMFAADEFRNKMIHSFWDESYGEFSRTKAKKGRKGLTVEREEADIKQLRDAVEAIHFLELVFSFSIDDINFRKQYQYDYDKLGKVLRPTPKPKKYENVFNPPEN
jgi:hypothetical protein